MSNIHKHSQEPTYYTYTYTTKQKSTSITTNNMSTSQYSSFSNNTTYKSLNLTTRINQIKPKSKLAISSYAKSMLDKTKRKSERQKQQELSKIIYDIQSPTRKTNHIITESIEYSDIKPGINWGKINFLCGFQERVVMGYDGCSCSDGCLWKKQWIKGFNSQDKQIYNKLLRQKPNKDNLIQIDKDILRTHPQCPTFSKNVNYQKMLKNILVAYSIYDVQLGYVQGINMITGVLLYHIKNAQQTFWALVQMMQYQQLRMIYLQNFQYLKIHCRNIDNIMMGKVNDLYNHMIQLQIISDVFLNGWLLSLMSTSIPMEYMHQVLIQFKKKGWRYIYKLIITYLLFLKDYLLRSDDQSQFLQCLNVYNSRSLSFQWKQMIISAQKLQI